MPVSKFPTSSIKDVQIRRTVQETQDRLNNIASQLRGILTPARGQKAPPNINPTVIKGAVSSVAGPDAVKLTGDVKLAKGANINITRAAQTFTFAVTGGPGSGLNADLLDGLDSLAFVKADGTVALTGAWNAGAFGISARSFDRDAAGVLNIGATTATGVTVGSVPFTVASAGVNRFLVSAPGTNNRLLSVAVGAGEAYSAILQFGALVTNSSANVTAVSATVQQAGTRAVAGALISGQQQLGGSILGDHSIGLDCITYYTAGSSFPQGSASKLYAGNFSLGFASNAKAVTNAFGVIIGNSGTAQSIVRYAGLLVSAKPAAPVAGTPVTVGVYSKDDISIEAGVNLIFDSTATFSTNLNQFGGSFTALTKGTTTLGWVAGTSTLDLAVVATVLEKRASASPHIQLQEGINESFGTATGTMHGTATNQKQSWWGATPIVQPVGTTDLRTALINMGLYASGGASPLNLNGGAFTSGAATVASGDLTVSAGDVLFSNNLKKTGAAALTIRTGVQANATRDLNYFEDSSAAVQYLIMGSEGVGGGDTYIDVQSTATLSLGKTTTTLLTAVKVNGTLILADAKNIQLGSTTGNKIGTATSQKLAFFNSSPIVQPSSTGTVLGHTTNAGTAFLSDADTFTGNVGATAYTIGDIVKHLKNLGLVAA